MQAKGKVATQFLGIAWVVFYCFLTYQQQYYGETILNAIIILPLYIYGAIHWLANRDKKDNVVIVRNNLSKKEWAVFIPSLLAVTICVFFLLQALNTAQLWLSTVAFCTMLPAIYLLMRRSKWNQLLFLINDIVLCCLWQILVFKGQLEFLTIFAYQIMQIIYDAYGIIVWWKLEKKQNVQKLAQNNDGIVAES
jgi:nicotinamide mononucleotide transporter PnuC